MMTLTLCVSGLCNKSTTFLGLHLRVPIILLALILDHVVLLCRAFGNGSCFTCKKSHLGRAFPGHISTYLLTRLWALLLTSHSCLCHSQSKVSRNVPGADREAHLIVKTVHVPREALHCLFGGKKLALKAATSKAITEGKQVISTSFYDKKVWGARFFFQN